MLIELLSTSNYVSYNIKLAQLLGLHSAIYLSELMNINDKAIRKKKTDNTSFKLDRKYITSRTTLTLQEQLDIESNLIKIGILEKPSDDKDVIILNINILTTLLMTDNEELIGDVKSLKKSKTGKQTKAEAIKETLKENIVASNEELREAYSSWIDSVYAKQGWMSKKSVVCAQQVVDDFAQHDLDVALKLISIADMNGYRDMTWAVNKFKEQYKVSYKAVSPPVKPVYAPTKNVLSDEVF